MAEGAPSDAEQTDVTQAAIARHHQVRFSNKRPLEARRERVPGSLLLAQCPHSHAPLPPQGAAERSQIIARVNDELEYMHGMTLDELEAAWRLQARRCALGACDR